MLKETGTICVIFEFDAATAGLVGLAGCPLAGKKAAPQ
jgi:hypothetical protein